MDVAVLERVGEAGAATEVAVEAPATGGAVLPADHPRVAAAKVGVVLLNLGTPEGTSYWPMRRYLSEFLSDRRVIDYPPWLWQPLLQLVILSKRPRTSGHAYATIWNRELDESPLKTVTRRRRPSWPSAWRRATRARASSSTGRCATASPRPRR
jgi:hypothetical protein